MKDQIPEVSVIVPAYNRVHVLHRSLLSVLAQRGVRLELIVVDDCSTDDTWQRLGQIRDRNPDRQIRLLRLERNSAQATARNRGLELARGEYVAFLDTDDALADQDILADMLTRARRDRLEMLVAPFRYFDGASLTEVSRLYPPEAVVDARRDPQIVDMRSHWHALYSRAFLERVPLRFAGSIRHREDRPFVIEALLQTRRLGAFDRPMVDYFRDMADSVMNNPTLREFGFYLEHLREVNGSFDRARVEGRLPPLFEQLNAVLYGVAHLHYWRTAWMQLTAAGDPASRDMTVAFDAELARLFQHSGLLFPLAAMLPEQPVIRDAGRDLVSGRIDLLRLAFLWRDEALVRAVLEGPDLPLSLLYALRDRGPEAALVAQRALAFAGDWQGRSPRLGRDRAPGGLVRRILLHVGGMKTGSSALQNWLEKNRFALLGQGFLYPATGTWREDGIRAGRNSGHVALIEGLLDSARAPAMRMALELEIAGLPAPPDTLILSLETILSPRFAVPGHDFAAIAAALGGQIEVVWLERAPAAWLASIHREQICNPRNGYTGSLDELSTEYDAAGLLDPEAVAARLTAPPAVSRLHRARYEEVCAVAGTIAYFCGIAGIDPQGLVAVEPAEANHSFDAAQAAQILALKQDRQLTPEQRDEMFRRIAAGQVPDVAAVVARYPAPRRSPGRLARLAGLNAASQPLAGGMMLHLLPPDLHLLRLPAGGAEDAVWLTGQDGHTTRLEVAHWGDGRVAPLDARLLAGCGGACRIELRGADGAVLTGADFRLAADPAAGMLRLVPAGMAGPVPRLLPRRQGGPADPARREVLLCGISDPVAARRYLAQVLGLGAAPDRLSPWCETDPVAGLELLGAGGAWQDYFNPRFYLRSNPDVARSGRDPLTHYVTTGEREGRSPAPGLRSAGDPAALPGWFAALVAGGQRWLVPRTAVPAMPGDPGPGSGTPPPVAVLVAAAIDPAFYAAQPGAPGAGDAVAAAAHYLREGHARGLDPVPWFSGAAYLRDHPDVAAAGQPAFAHYLVHGAAEGRRIQPAVHSPVAAAGGEAALVLARLRLGSVLAGRRARVLLIGGAARGLAPGGDVLWLGAMEAEPLAAILPPGPCPPVALAAILREVAEHTGAERILGLDCALFHRALLGGMTAGPGLRVEVWLDQGISPAILPLLDGLSCIHFAPGSFEAAGAGWTAGLPPIRAGSLATALG